MEAIKRSCFKQLEVQWICPACMGANFHEEIYEQVMCVHCDAEFKVEEEEEEKVGKVVSEVMRDIELQHARKGFQPGGNAIALPARKEGYLDGLNFAMAILKAKF